MAPPRARDIKPTTYLDHKSRCSMSMKSSLFFQSVVQQLRTSSLCPFLYSTKTLSFPSLSRKAFRAPNNHLTRCRNFTSIPQHQAGAYNTPRPNENPFEDDVFANPRSDRLSDSDVPLEDVESRLAESGKSKKSTMTPSEKAAFDRIFKDIDESTAATAIEEVAFDEQDAESDPYEDLNSIFDRAIQDLRLREEHMADKLARDEQRQPQRYRRAMDELLVVKDTAGLSSRAFLRPLRLVYGNELEGEVDMQESEENLKKACEDHKGLVSNLLERATTDVQIWDLLEEEVFSLINHLDVQIKFDQKARKAIERQEKRLAKEKGKEKAANADEDGDIDDKGALKDTALNAPAPAALPTNTLISILQSNYADYLVSALRLFRRHHPSSFYALYLLPHMKRLGPISYVLGASTGLYNEILFLKWTQFSDLHAMADLMQEMLNQGIETNEVTMVFIRRLWAKRRHGLIGRFGPVMQKWWDMRGNREGWNRVWAMYLQIKEEEKEKAERDALVQNQAYDGEGEVDEGG